MGPRGEKPIYPKTVARRGMGIVRRLELGTWFGFGLGGRTVAELFFLSEASA